MSIARTLPAPAAFAPGGLPPPAPPQHDHTLARHALLMAQVELYCSHDAAAIVALRAAHRSLLADTCLAIAALTSLDEAACHIRHHAVRDALQAITRARDSLL